MKIRLSVLSLICQVVAYIKGVCCSWDEWWTYDGISGPDYWGLLNPDWRLCNKGRHQSPVDIDPNILLHDPHLRSLKIDKVRVSGVVTNTGHGVVFRITSSKPGETVNITGGPLSYRYRLHEIYLHFGRTDDRGSEHTVAGNTFPAELQIYGYNSDLYPNITEAFTLHRSHSIVGVAVLLQLGEISNAELRVLTSQLHRIIYRGQEAPLQYLSIKDLLPDTDIFMTYEGSTTMPGCSETVTWIIMNKPIYITKQQLYALRNLMQGEEENPKTPLANNFRPTLPLNHRSIRTNLDFRRKEGKTCPTMYKTMYYKA
ncbi:putative carbonic anhydrase-like protein 2 [Centruroides vittatus]|uniref:putative carbonic anhydrase-like protein 2 n=1 Tax=Centruroides vittatus TaxID=120091 RepID=UPI00350F40F0